MVEQTQNGPVAKRRRWPKVVGLMVGVLLLLVVSLYFVVTSSAFFKGTILPRMGKAMNATITVGGASIKPFSEVVLQDLKVQPNGEETLLTASEIKLRYNLRAILGGNLLVREITVESPVVELIQKPDGSSNVDPLLEGGKSEPRAEPGNGATPKIDIQQINLRNATVRIVQQQLDGPPRLTELTNLGIELQNLKNNEEASLKLASAIRVDQPATDPARGASLTARTDGTATFILNDDLQPGAARTSMKLVVNEASGALRELAQSVVTLDGDITPAEIKNLTLAFSRDQTRLGQLRIHGPFSLAKQEGRLNVEFGRLDRQALNLIGVPFGIDFTTTQLQSTNQLEIASGASSIKISGRFDASELKLIQQGRTTPTMNLDLDYSLALNQSNQSAVLQRLNVTGVQNDIRVLRTELTSPMTIAWGNAAGAMGDATLKVTVDRFNLADWKDFAPELSPAGQMHLDLSLEAKEGGKRFSLTAGGNVQGLQATLGTNQISGGKVVLKAQTDVASVEPLDASVAANLELDGTLSNAGTPATTIPLQSVSQIKAGLRDNVLQLDEARLTLAPTSRAKNELLVTGRIDLTRTNAIQGNVKVTAEALDLTSYYDLFAGQPKSNESGTTESPTGSTSAGTSAEPEPMEPPFRDFTVDLNVGHVYLRELELADWQTTTKLDGGSVRLNPFKLTVNGAPVVATADLDLGVPGYRYDVHFNADGIPLAPIANSFSPSYRDQASGDVIASLDLKGQGVTGTSLRQHLAGQMDFTFTNANIKLVGPKARLLILTISTALRLPDLSQSPLNWMNAGATISDGKINLSTLGAQSPAFTLHSSGVIPIADNLKASPLNDLPVEISLRRPLAASAGLIPANAPTNTDYVALPVFLKVTGTLGKTEFKTDKLVLAGLTANSLGASGLVGGEAGKILQGVGNLLGGSNTSGTSTNQSTNTPPNLLDLFKKPK